MKKTLAIALLLGLFAVTPALQADNSCCPAPAMKTEQTQAKCPFMSQCTPEVKASCPMKSACDTKAKKQMAKRKARTDVKGATLLAAR